MTRLKTLALGGAASAAIALFALPAAYAQVSSNGPQYSSPAEKEQTRELNMQALNGTTAPPAALNGEQSGEQSGEQQVAQDEPPPPPDTQAPPAQDQAAPPPDDQSAPQQSDAQQRYRQQLDQYNNQRAEYESRRSDYDRELRKYDRREYAFEDYPAHAYAYRYDADDDYGRALDRLSDPEAVLYKKPIESPSGEWVGRVREVVLAPDGRPERIEVALNRRVSVWASPDHFRYDRADGVVMTDLSRDELWGITDATVDYGS